MYKILLLRSARGINGVNSLYNFLTNMVIHEDGTSEEVVSEFSDETELKNKILELLEIHSKKDIYVVTDKTYSVDILFSPAEGETET